MQFYRDLYVSPKIRHPERVKWRLRHNAGSLALYVITLCDETLSERRAPSHGVSASGEPPVEPSGRGRMGQLLLFHCINLQQPYEKKHCPMIIGIAEGRAEALELVRRITQECVEKTGGADLVPFLARRDLRIRPYPAPSGRPDSAFSDAMPERQETSGGPDSDRCGQFDDAREPISGTRRPDTEESMQEKGDAL